MTKQGLSIFSRIEEFNTIAFSHQTGKGKKHKDISMTILYILGLYLPRPAYADHQDQGDPWFSIISCHGGGGWPGTCSIHCKAPLPRQHFLLLGLQPAGPVPDSQDHTNPPDWRTKPFTQVFDNFSSTHQCNISKINRNFNSIADSLAMSNMYACTIAMIISARYWKHWPMYPWTL